jgi:hypothetical protein
MLGAMPAALGGHAAHPKTTYNRTGFVLQRPRHEFAMFHARLADWLAALPRLRDGAVNRAVFGSLFGGVHACGFVFLGFLFLRYGMARSDIASYPPSGNRMLPYAGGPVFAAILGMILVGGMAMTTGTTRRMSGAVNGAIAGIAGSLAGGILAFLLYWTVGHLDREETINTDWRLVLTVTAAGGTAAAIAWCCDRFFSRVTLAGTLWYLRGAVILEALLVFTMGVRFIEVRQESFHWYWLRLAATLVFCGLIAGLLTGSRRLEFVAQNRYAFWLAPMAGLCLLGLMCLMPPGKQVFGGKSVNYWHARLYSSNPAERDRAVEVFTEMLHSRHPPMRLWAAETLAKANPFVPLEDGVRAVLLEGLKDPDPVTRQIALECLRRDFSEVIREALKEFEPMP